MIFILLMLIEPLIVIVFNRNFSSCSLVWVEHHIDVSLRDLSRLVTQILFKCSLGKLKESCFLLLILKF